MLQSSHSSAKLAESIEMPFGFRARESEAGSRTYKLGSWFNGRRRWPLHVRCRHKSSRSLSLIHRICNA